VYLTFQVPDRKDENVVVNDTFVQFTAFSGTNKQMYATKLELYEPVDPESAKKFSTGQNLFLILRKKEAGPYWPRLLKDSKKQHWLKTDFARWKDEDEEDEDISAAAASGSPFMGGNPFEGMDMSSMAGAGNPFLDMGAEQGDSDDEEETEAPAAQ
jgi:topoisomerase IA-like protein